MTPEEKQLLLKDLCARLPYEVKGKVYAETTDGEYDMYGDMIFLDSPFDVILDEINTSTEEIHVIAIGNEDTVDFIEDQQINGKPYIIDDFKPYLRPMSSMSEKEKDELALIGDKDFQSVREWYNAEYMNESGTPCPVTSGKIDYCNKNHFDYRGLIPMGLALEAPEGMYKTE